MWDITSVASQLPLLTTPFDRYAYFKGLDYFTTECIYSPEAYRGYARTFLKDLEAMRPCSILGTPVPLPACTPCSYFRLADIIRSGEAYSVRESANAPVLGKTQPEHFGEACTDGPMLPDFASGTCDRCGYMSSGRICKACMLLEALSAT